MINYRRRTTNTFPIGGIAIGSNQPIRLQSMTSTSTMDTDASVEQCIRIADAGADYVRLTAQGVREATNIGEIRRQLRQRGCNVPLVADIHFNPKAAFEAARQTDKVRINPGNFVDAARTFKKLTFTDEEYQAEIEKIRDALLPFIALCRENGTAVRLGVNHGSLSDRIMSRYGDTPAGMVESVMEFLRVFVAEKFLNVVISIKASNVTVMVETVRRLVVAMDAEDMHFPLHLGVTEAGDGEDGRVKSAVGIGTLLNDGYGDTIRVSLSEEPELEIPVAQKLADYIGLRQNENLPPQSHYKGYCATTPARRTSHAVNGVGGNLVPVVVSSRHIEGSDLAVKPDFYLDSLPENWQTVDCDSASVEKIVAQAKADTVIVLRAEQTDKSVIGQLLATMHAITDAGIEAPVVPMITYHDTDVETLQVKAASDFGTLLMNGFRDGIWLDAPDVDAATAARCAFGILQAARLRMSKTEFISCPSCGRTLFDLQTTVREVKAATSHLTHLKIGIMGCIVNGPGEMADADFGYVGAAVGKISLYKGKECVEKNIPQSEAIPRLIALIKSSGAWIEPPTEG